MAKPAWLLMVWFAGVPATVWSAPVDQPQPASEGEHYWAFHDGGPAPEDEGSTTIQLPRLNVKGFLDVGFNVSSANDQRDDTFAMGQFNLLLTSRLTERAYFLAETYFTNPDNNTQAYMLTRANVQYTISRLINVRVGQVHTSIGYWNQIYHHGSFVQTTVSRPEIFRYDRAYLPIHSVGVEVFGGLEGGAVDLSYTVGVFNGRGKVPPAVNRVKDDNDEKGLAVLINVSPHAVDGLSIGATFYNDTIPPNPDLPTRTASIAERIIGGDLVYKTNRLELLGEVFNIYHDDHTSNQVFDSLGWYAQAAYVIKDLTPYYRFDVLNFGGVDPYYAPNVLDVYKHTLGARWDFMPWNALKVEYAFFDYRDVDHEQLLSTNLSFAF